MHSPRGLQSARFRMHTNAALALRAQALPLLDTLIALAKLNSKAALADPAAELEALRKAVKLGSSMPSDDPQARGAPPLLPPCAPRLSR